MRLYDQLLNAKAEWEYLEPLVCMSTTFDYMSRYRVLSDYFISTANDLEDKVFVGFSVVIIKLEPKGDGLLLRIIGETDEYNVYVQRTENKYIINSTTDKPLFDHQTLTDYCKRNMIKPEFVLDIVSRITTNLLALEDRLEEGDYDWQMHIDWIENAYRREPDITYARSYKARINDPTTTLVARSLRVTNDIIYYDDLIDHGESYDPQQIIDWYESKANVISSTDFNIEYLD